MVRRKLMARRSSSRVYSACGLCGVLMSVALAVAVSADCFKDDLSQASCESADAVICSPRSGGTAERAGCLAHGFTLEMYRDGFFRPPVDSGGEGGPVIPQEGVTAR